MRAHRISNAIPINVKDVFDVSGGPNSQIYGTSGQINAGQINQAYEPIIDDADRNSLRLAPRIHQAVWSGGGGGGVGGVGVVSGNNSKL